MAVRFRVWLLMSKASKQIAVPKLRFPEFHKDGSWSELPLSKVCQVNPPSNGLPDNFVYIDLESVDSGRLLQKRTISRVDAPSRAQRLLIFGDIIYQTVRPYQKNNLFFKENDGSIYVASTGYAQLRAHESSSYLFQYLHAEQFVDLVLKKCTGTSYPAINSTDLSNISIMLPKLDEQEKIADCLSSLDELITAQKDKVVALGSYKKGLLQQLFPQNGDSMPRLRFPEFRKSNEWKRKTLGEIVDVASGLVDPTQLPFCDLPHVGGENIESHTGSLRDVKTAKELRLISGKYYFDESYVLYSKIRPALNKVAIPDFKGICSADIYPIRPSVGELRREYLFYLLLSESFLKYAIKHSDRGKIPKINRDTLLTYMTVIPTSAEQQRISECLSTLDAQIAAESDALAILEEHKRGLLQQLFPTPISEYQRGS